MKANIIVVPDSAFVVMARQMMDRDEITLEQYAEVLRRSK